MTKGTDLALGLGSDMEEWGRQFRKRWNKGVRRGKHEGQEGQKKWIWNVVSERDYNISRLCEDWTMESLEVLHKAVDFTQQATRSPPTRRLRFLSRNEK